MDESKAQFMVKKFERICLLRGDDSFMAAQPYGTLYTEALA